MCVNTEGPRSSSSFLLVRRVISARSAQEEMGQSIAWSLGKHISLIVTYVECHVPFWSRRRHPESSSRFSLARLCCQISCFNFFHVISFVVFHVPSFSFDFPFCVFYHLLFVRKQIFIGSCWHVACWMELLSPSFWVVLPIPHPPLVWSLFNSPPFLEWCCLLLLPRRRRRRHTKGGAG